MSTQVRPLRPEDQPAFERVTKLVTDAYGAAKPPKFVLIALRNLATKPDEWGDLIGWWSPDNFKLYAASTYPGVAMMIEPVNPAGAAIIQPGLYRRVYSLGNHLWRPDHPAFRQIGPMRVRRVPKGRKNWDVLGSEITVGSTLNLHRANANSLAQVVGPHSSGCQVIRRIESLNEALAAAKLYGSGIAAFDYLLVVGSL